MQLLEMTRPVRKSILSLTPTGPRGGSRISRKWGHKYKGVGVVLLNLSHLSEISHENEIFWSHRDQIILFSWNI